jgi:hypothetical protein
LAQRTADTSALEDDARLRNRAMVRPSAQEISRMEAAISWPGRYVTDRERAKTVQLVALYRARDQDLGYACRKMRVGLRQGRESNREALDTIAAGLRRDAVRVF